ncbi:YdeI/OmpD-associated family protein [Arcticibacter eurypsychrophilus]|uniref:YdeI/OmpD-associated family protein n=1 Tax=Arcticibacter eurypsychrophilus TaxID=1434752 RepID=UPI00084DEE6A|nr:YdeI/OmpD-associated family protein [Arcticibacter eurypsychrophilus]
MSSSITNKKAEFQAVLQPVEGSMVHHVIPVPLDVCTLFRENKGAIRILCSIKGLEEFPCALNPREDRYVIMASKQLIKKHKLLTDVPFVVSIRSDLNDGLEIPDELLEVLNQDDHFRSMFDALLPGHKRGILYYIRTAKSVDTRIKRCLDLAYKIKAGLLHYQQPKE